MNSVKNYIGIATTFHDPAISIVNEFGEVVFCEAAERSLQNKRGTNSNGLTYQIYEKLIKKYCTPGADIVLCHTWSRESLGYLIEGDKFLGESEKFMDSMPDVPFFHKREVALARFTLSSQMSAFRQAEANVRYAVSRLQGGFEKSRIETRYFDHHLTHAMTASYTSPYEDAVCLIVDGEGEQSRCTNLYRYSGGKLTLIEPAEYHSDAATDVTLGLGHFYMMMTQACGFNPMSGEEWKIMGLSVLGEVNDDLYAKLRQFLTVKGCELSPITLTQKLELYEILSDIERKPGEPVISSASVAATAQKVYTDVLFEILSNIYDLGLSENLVLGGGCALNSSANGKVVSSTGFKSLHVYAAPADDGNALGASLLAYYEDNAQKLSARSTVFTPYLGSDICVDSLDKLKQFSGIKYRECEDVASEAAKLLAEGKIIAWMQGRAEFGPRALGNRSILANPTLNNIKDTINSRVKFREEFRPFAPSILHEFGRDYFENYQVTPYMERTLSFHDSVKPSVPGVVHDDGTGRLQSVTRELNLKYYQLIRAFFDITGIPIVLNTSFNVMNKPIVHSVEDAVTVFTTTGLDALVINNTLFEKEQVS